MRPGAGSAAARAVAPASEAWVALVAATSLQMEGRAEMGRGEGGPGVVGEGMGTVITGWISIALCAETRVEARRAW